MLHSPQVQVFPGKGNRIHGSPSASPSPASVSPDSLQVRNLGSKPTWRWVPNFLKVRSLESGEMGLLNRKASLLSWQAEPCLPVP